MTRVLFDGYWWAQGPGANRMVMRELINAWSKHYPEDELIIAVRHRHRDQVLDAPRGVQLAETRLWPQAASNVVELPMLARRHRADVVVCHNYAPVTGASVVFVHDLLFRDHPEWFSRAERLYFDLMPVTSKRASTVVTSSEAESDRIRRITQRREVPAVGLAVPRELADCAAEPVPLEHERFALIVNPTGAETFNSHAVEASICNIPGLADRFVYFNDDFFIGRPVDPDFYFPGGFAYANPLPSYIATRDMHAHGMLNAVGAINEHFTRKEYFAGLSRGFRRRLISDGVRLPLTLTSKRIPPVGDVHLPTPLVTDIVREAFRADAARIEETRRSVFRSATDVAPIYLAMMWHVARGEFSPVSKRKLGAFMSLESSDPAAEFAKLLAGDPAQFCINDNVRVDDPQLEDALRDALHRRWPDPSPFELDEC